MAGARSRPPRVCIVGAGVMGRWHAHAAGHVGATVVAIVDVEAQAARTLATRHEDASTFSTLADALASGAVDAVHVCTPRESHVALVEAALERGCHTLVEKPLARSSAETARLLARGRERGVLVTPVHQFPFQSGVRGVLGRLDRLGELVRVSYRTCSAGGEGLAPEARRRVLLEILPHPASLLHRVFGDGLDETALAIARFTDDDLDLTGHAGDTRVDVSISLRGRPTRNELELVGTGGTAHADLFHGFAFLERGTVSRPAKVVRPFGLGARLLAGAGVNLAARAVRREPAYPGLRELVRAFYAAALDGAATPIDEAEILLAARLLDRVGGASPV